MGGGGFLGLGPAPSAPAAPNYAAAAQETASGNLDAARAATAANRINQVTPYGNLNYTQSGTDAYGNPTYTATQTLSPAQQRLLDTQNQISGSLGEVANKGVSYVENMLNTPFDTSGLAQLQSGVSPADMQRFTGQANLGQANEAQQAQGITSGEMAQRVGGGPQFQGLETADALRRSGDTDALQRSLGENVGMAGWDRASNLLMSRLNPQIEQSQERLQAQLANQGIVAGTEAYNRAMTQQGQKENDLRTQAQLQAQGIQQNLFGQELQAGQFGNQAATQQQQNLLQNLGFSNQAQQQDYANRQAQLAFNNQLGQLGYQNQLAGQQANNQAIAQNFGQGLSAQQLQNQAGQQNFANQLAGMGFNNQQIQQMYQNQQAQQQANNAIAQQQFANQMAGANLSNQARQQGLQEQAYLRNEPLNTLSAVRTGSQVQGPQFVNSFNQATTQGADLLGAAGMQYNAQMGDFNQKQAAQQNFNQGLMGLGGAGIMAFSDIRMKENIKQIHWLPNGLPVYEFEYKPEFKDIAGYGKFVGVMAQEAELVQPEAVITNANGYKMVNYGLLT
jgi:hypothetical protein